MKKIMLIATGGTIASKNTEGGLAPAIASDELLDFVPEISTVADVTAVQAFNLDSTNICAAHWLEIARLIRANYTAFDGFVVTHGTDTMAYSAAALSYLAQGLDKPVVFTGSQKSVYLRDTDARKNLADAFFYCADGDAAGVKIVFDGKIILGTRAKKTRTRSYNAFTSIDYPEIGILREGSPYYYIREEKPRTEPVFYAKMNERVFVLKLFPGISADVFDYFDGHCDGLIVESFGAGGVPDYGGDAFFKRMKKFAEGGKFVVFTTQVEREGSALAKYAVGRKLLDCGNVLEARSMTLEATLTKMMWLLGNFAPREIAERFYLPVQKDII